MSLEPSIAKLREIAKDARSLFEVLMELAGLGKKTTAIHRRKIERLAERLDTTSREASRDRRQQEIRELEGVIRAHECTLGVPGLPHSAREAVRADLIRKKARKTRLFNQEATDFGGILTGAEVERIVELTVRAEKEVEQREFAAEFLDLTFRIADLALSLAGRLDL